MADKKPPAKKAAPAKKAPAKKAAAKKAPAKKAAAPKKTAEKKTEETPLETLLGTVTPKVTTSTTSAGHTHVTTTFTVPESVDKFMDDVAPVLEAVKKTNFFKRLFKRA